MIEKKTANFEDTKIPTINEESSDMMGDIRINHSVVASIVRLAATEIDGVHTVGSSFVDGIAEIFSKKETERGVRVTEDEAGHYVIDIRVILSFGVELAKVGLQIQENVRDMVTRMTMKNISRVNVTIDGVKMEIPNTEERPDYEKSVQ